MKEFFLKCTALLLLFAAVTILAAEPESFIPADSPLIMRFNANKLVQMPWWKDAAKQNKSLKKIAVELDRIKAESNIVPADIFAGDMWAAQVGKEDFITLIKTNITKSRFIQLLEQEKARKGRKAAYKSSVVGGLTVYILGKSGEEAALIYVAEDVMLIFKAELVSEALIASVLDKKANPLLKSIDRKALFALYGDAKKMQLPAKKSKVLRLAATAELEGASQRDLRINGKLVCRNEKIAMQLAMQAQFMYPGVVGMLFGKDEALSSSLFNSLQIVPEKNVITGVFTLSGDQQLKIVKYMSNPANRPNFKHDSAGAKTLQQ